MITTSHVVSVVIQRKHLILASVPYLLQNRTAQVINGNSLACAMTQHEFKAMHCHRNDRGHNNRGAACLLDRENPSIAGMRRHKMVAVRKHADSAYILTHFKRFPPSSPS